MINDLGYKIVEADVVFTTDFFPVLHHGTSANVYRDGKIDTININQTTYQELKSYSQSPDVDYPFTTVDSLFQLASKKDICVLLDLTFQKYSMSCLRILYGIVCKYNMQDKTIWGDVNVYKMAIINRHLTCQVGGSWGRKLIAKSIWKSMFCRQLIMSFSYYGGRIEPFGHIVRIGHRLGFLMKVATVNDIEKANRFWKIGTDLINTDVLLNNNTNI